MNGVADGARTHDNQNHNLALYQLNYGHHTNACLARPAGLEPATLGLEGRCSIRLSYGRIRFHKMVGVERFELPTHCSQSSCATRLRYTPTGLISLNSSSWRILIRVPSKFNHKISFIALISRPIIFTSQQNDKKNGAPGRIRTSDRLVRSQVL